VAQRLQDDESRPKAHFGISSKRARAPLADGDSPMDIFDPDRDLRGGGRARDGGCYHLSFRSGSRGRGACAGAAFNYISRTGEYDDPDRDPAIYTESDHMPAWAEDDPHEYWDAADLFERANGRLYVAADFALPRDLDPDDQIELAHTFAEELTADGHLPYTLAVHAGRDDAGREHNPHAHLMISERQNDGIDRDRQQWFKRANRAHPERGGAPKTREFHGREWVEHARERWAQLTNEMLERNGRAARVDHRSYERQGIDREPGQHYGPAAAHMAKEGIDHERLREAAEAADAAERLEAIDRALALIAAGRGRGEPSVDDESYRRPSREGSGSYGRDGDDWSPGR
jgi:MobA/MobL family protein